MMHIYSEYSGYVRTKSGTREKGHWVLPDDFGQMVFLRYPWYIFYILSPDGRFYHLLCWADHLACVSLLIPPRQRVAHPQILTSTLNHRTVYTL